MLKTSLRSVRAIGTALVIAAVPVASFSITPTAAQGLMTPDLGTETYPLTADLVIAWVESYPAVIAEAESLEGQFDVPEGEDPMAGLAALGMVNEAMDILNNIVDDYGFDDWDQWTNVMFSVVFAYSILEAPAEQQPMLIGMFGQTQENLDAVAVHQDEVRALVDSL